MDDILPPPAGLLQVKGNQPTLLRLIQRLPWRDAPTHTTIDHGHGRYERRTARLIPVTGAGLRHGDLPWPDVTAAIRIDRTRETANGTVHTTAWFITSRPLSGVHDLALLAMATRAHWSIENQLHWVRDVVYHEDASQRHITNLPVILAACVSIAIATARRFGGTHAEARTKLKNDVSVRWTAKAIQAEPGHDEGSKESPCPPPPIPATAA